MAHDACSLAWGPHIRGMTQLPALPGPDLDIEITALAWAYGRANGPFVKLVNRFGVKRKIRI